MILADVREKIDGIRAELPSDVQRVNIQSWGTNDEPIIGGQFSSEHRSAKRVRSARRQG